MVVATAGSETVTWQVAGTDRAALAPYVRISLSTDGGLTFPTVLAASTPNDGSHTVTLPAVATTTARIKVEAVGNYFFDVNDADFAIGTVLGRGRGSIASVQRSSKRVPTAHGPARFRFTIVDSGSDLAGLATFRFRRGKIAFVADEIVSSQTFSGKRIRFTASGTNRGQGGYRMVVTALDKGRKDRIRVRVFRHHRLVYDSMPGARPTARPRTRVQGQVTVP